MKTLSRFVAKFTSLIVTVLSCFDRVIFKGHLPIAYESALEQFVDHVLKIRRDDFMDFAQEQSETLVDHAKRMAQQADAEYRFLQGTHRKDKLVEEILRRRPISEGLICVLCCMECRGSFRLRSGKDRPRLVNARRQQRVLYFYYLDPKLGLIHIRLQTWFPFPVQVYVNGHSFLAQEMLKRRIGFTQQDNAFTALDDPKAAQKLADSFVRENWPKILNRLVRQVNPLMNEPWFRSLTYYWVVDQAEYSTDLIFTSREALGDLYPRLLDHAAVNFSAQGHPHVPGPTAPSSVRRGSVHSVPEGSLARGTDQTPDEEQLAEDVRQVRLGPADRDRDQQSAGVPGPPVADP